MAVIVAVLVCRRDAREGSKHARYYCFDHAGGLIPPWRLLSPYTSCRGNTVEVIARNYRRGARGSRLLRCRNRQRWRGKCVSIADPCLGVGCGSGRTSVVITSFDRSAAAVVSSGGGTASRG